QSPAQREQDLLNDPLGQAPLLFLALDILHSRTEEAKKPDAMIAALRRVIATNLTLRNELVKRGANALKQSVDGTIKELVETQHKEQQSLEMARKRWLQELTLEKQTQTTVVDDDTETKQIAKVDEIKNEEIDILRI
ncbi:hypothetical protein RFI_35463, partial [Reticulomyxa filosa]